VAAQARTELNDIEVVWHDLKTHHLAHKTLPFWIGSSTLLWRT
jgi:hypothetical protein